MKLDEIHDMWDVDCEVDRTQLGEESLRLAKLHSKYLRFYSNERMLLRKMEEERKVFIKLKHDYFRGLLSEEELKEQGWKPFLMNVIKSEVPLYVEADQDVVKINLRIAVQQEKVDVLESIIKTIKDRGFQIKNAIDFRRFNEGA